MSTLRTCKIKYKMIHFKGLDKMSIQFIFISIMILGILVGLKLKEIDKKINKIIKHFNIKEK